MLSNICPTDTKKARRRKNLHRTQNIIVYEESFAYLSFAKVSFILLNASVILSSEVAYDIRILLGEAKASPPTHATSPSSSKNKAKSEDEFIVLPLYDLPKYELQSGNK